MVIINPLRTHIENLLNGELKDNLRNLEEIEVMALEFKQCIIMIVTKKIIYFVL